MRKSMTEPPVPGHRYQCPCCKFRTLEELGVHEICPVCFWQDDGQDEHDAEVVRGGPNSDLSLRLAQANYARFGAVEERFCKHVRPPKPGEIQEDQ